MRNGILIAVTMFLALLALSSLFWMWRYPMQGMSMHSTTWQGELTIDQAKRLAEDYLTSLGNKDLAIDEIMEFELNFYIVYYEKSTGIGAFEAIIDKANTEGMMGMMGYGYVRPEQGPNMMWNSKYLTHGMRDGNTISFSPPITEEQAREYAQKYLDEYIPSAIAEDVHPFYGYYTIHVMTNDKISGMLSVNSYTGQVWYHNWHGNYIQTLKISEG